MSHNVMRLPTCGSSDQGSLATAGVTACPEGQGRAPAAAAIIQLRDVFFAPFPHDALCPCA